MVSFIRKLPYVAYIRLASLYDNFLFRKIVGKGSAPTIVQVNAYGIRYKLRVNPLDTGISKDLLLKHIREPLVTKFLVKNKFIQSNERIFDIGANIGYYAIMGGLLARNGKVLAIEPVQANVNLLLENIRINGLKNIEVLKEAITDKNGTARIYLSTRSNWHSIVKGWAHTKNYIVVPTSTVDSLTKKYWIPTYIRMDVEGGEKFVIKGMRKLLKSDQPLKIFIEHHPRIIGKDSVRINMLLERRGFRIVAAFADPDMSLYGKNGNYRPLAKLVAKIRNCGPILNTYEEVNRYLKEEKWALHVLYER